jgi:hypothetical protein
MAIQKNKKRVVIDLHANETITNQIAYQAYEAGHNMADVRDFIRRTDRCSNLDQLLRTILAEYEVLIKDDDA